MDEEQFFQLQCLSYLNEAPAEIFSGGALWLGLVDNKSGSEEYGETIFQNACMGEHVDLAQSALNILSEDPWRGLSPQEAETICQ